MVVEVVEKQTISDQPRYDPAVVGSFYFARGKDFVRGAESMIAADCRVNGEFYVGTSINQLIRQGLTVRTFPVEKFLSFGDPLELRVFQAWKSSSTTKRVTRIDADLEVWTREVQRRVAVLQRGRRSAEIGGALPAISGPLGFRVEFLVDNGSTDESAKRLAGLCLEPQNWFVRTVTVERNIGYGNGLLQGLRSAESGHRRLLSC